MEKTDMIQKPERLDLIHSTWRLMPHIFDLSRRASILLLVTGLVISSNTLVGLFYQNLGAVALNRVIIPKQIAFDEAEIGSHDLTQAMANLSSAVARNPESVSASRLMATLFFVQHDFSNAEVWSLRTLRLTPSDALTYLCLGYVYMLTGRPNEAVQAWRSSGDVSYILSRAWPYYSNGKKKEEEAKFLATAQLSVRNDSVQLRTLIYGDLGIYYGREGRWAESVQVLRQALALTPDAYYYRLWLGGAIKQLGHLDQAKVELLRALETPDKSIRGHVYANLGEVYKQAGDLEKAVDAFREAVGLFPDNFDYRLRLAQAYLDTGRLVEALDEYHVLLTLHPNDETSRAEYDRLLMLLGK